MSSSETSDPTGPHGDGASEDPKSAAMAACSRCHTSKVRCSLGRPCDRCQRKGVECVPYVPHKRGRKRHSEVAAGAAAATPGQPNGKAPAVAHPAASRPAARQRVVAPAAHGNAHNHSHSHNHGGLGPAAAGAAGASAAAGVSAGAGGVGGAAGPPPPVADAGAHGPPVGPSTVGVAAAVPAPPLAGAGAAAPNGVLPGQHAAGQPALPPPRHELDDTMVEATRRSMHVFRPLLAKVMSAETSAADREAAIVQIRAHLKYLYSARKMEAVELMWRFVVSMGMPIEFAEIVRDDGFTIVEGVDGFAPDALGTLVAPTEGIPATDTTQAEPLHLALFRSHRSTASMYIVHEPQRIQVAVSSGFERMFGYNTVDVVHLFGRGIDIMSALLDATDLDDFLACKARLMMVQHPTHRCEHVMRCFTKTHVMFLALIHCQVAFDAASSIRSAMWTFYALPSSRYLPTTSASVPVTYTSELAQQLAMQMLPQPRLQPGPMQPGPLMPPSVPMGMMNPYANLPPMSSMDMATLFSSQVGSPAAGPPSAPPQPGAAGGPPSQTAGMSGLPPGPAFAPEPASFRPVGMFGAMNPTNL